VGRYEGRTFEDRDVSFVVGESSEVGLIDGIDQAIKKFKKGERSVLKVKSKYAYGTLGCEEFNIPANADLEYEVELKNFEKVSSGNGSFGLIPRISGATFLKLLRKILGRFLILFGTVFVKI